MCNRYNWKHCFFFNWHKFFWPAYHNSWTIFNTVVCLSKHISKCHLNEILDKSVIICADKRWTSTLEQQSVQLSNNKWFHLMCFKLFSIYFNQSQCIVWQCWLLCWIVIGWTYQNPVVEKTKDRSMKQCRLGGADRDWWCNDHSAISLHQWWLYTANVSPIKSVGNPRVAIYPL